MEKLVWQTKMIVKVVYPVLNISGQILLRTPT